MIKSSALILWLILPSIAYSCSPNKNRVSVMTGIQGGLSVVTDDGYIKENCRYRKVDNVITYYVSTLKYYALSITPEYDFRRKTVLGVDGDAVTFDDAYENVSVNSRTISTPYAQINHWYDTNSGPEYRVWFTKEGTYDLNFSYGNHKNSIRVCCDNTSTFHSEYWTRISNLYTWIDDLKVEDLTEAILEEGYIGVAPGSFVYVTHTKDTDDMTNARYLLDSLAIKVNTPTSHISGGSYKKYIYQTAAESHALYVSNGLVYHTNEDETDVYYLLPKTITISNPYQKACKFLSYGSSTEVKKVSDDTVLTSIDYLADIEFVEWGEEVSGANEPLYYINDSSMLSDKLTIYASNRFEYKGVFYKIINDKTFAFCE